MIQSGVQLIDTLAAINYKLNCVLNVKSFILILSVGTADMPTTVLDACQGVRFIRVESIPAYLVYSSMKIIGDL